MTSWKIAWALPAPPGPNRRRRRYVVIIMFMIIIFMFMFMIIFIIFMFIIMITMIIMVRITMITFDMILMRIVNKDTARLYNPSPGERKSLYQHRVCIFGSGWGVCIFSGCAVYSVILGCTSIGIHDTMVYQGI